MVSRHASDRRDTQVNVKDLAVVQITAETVKQKRHSTLAEPGLQTRK